MSLFREKDLSLDSYWRSVILIGKNVASYKFALAKSLLDLANKETTFINLDDLAIPFSKNICEHLKSCDKQGISSGSKFLNACRQFNNSKITHEELLGTTARLGFQNVIDAFHVVNNRDIPIQFYIDERKTKKGITITDNLLRMKELFPI